MYTYRMSTVNLPYAAALIFYRAIQSGGAATMCQRMKYDATLGILCRRF